MYLYVITDGEFQKIGTATNPHTRVKELQTGNPRKLHVLKTFEHENAPKLERAFHYLMDSGRQQGGWHTFCCPTCKDDYHNEHNPERKQIYRSKRTG